MPPGDGRCQPQKEETLLSSKGGRQVSTPKRGNPRVPWGWQVGTGPKRRGPSHPQGLQVGVDLKKR